jgi:hypothetical protein
MHTPCPSIGLFKSFRAKPSSTALKSLTRQDGVKEQSPNGYSLVPNDIRASFSSFTQNQHLQDANRCSKLAIGRGTKFYVSPQLEGVGRIPRATHVFLEYALDV